MMNWQRFSWRSLRTITVMAAWGLLLASSVAIPGCASSATPEAQTDEEARAEHEARAQREIQDIRGGN